MNDTFLAEFTTAPTDDRILIAGHGQGDGTVIHFKLGTPSNVLPNPLVVDQDYFVVNARVNDFKVSETLGGLPVDITNAGVGVNDVWLVGASADVTEYKLVTALCHAADNKKSFVTDDNEQPFEQLLQEILAAWGGELVGGISVQLMSQTSPVRVLLTQAMTRKSATRSGGKHERDH
jgi:hypothetical protein